MAKKKGDKGFIKEIARSKNSHVEQPQKKFTYSKALTPESKQTDDMSTPNRIKNFKSSHPTRDALSFAQDVADKIRRRRAGGGG